MKYLLSAISGDSMFILQSLTTSKMRKCQTIKLSQLHKAKTVFIWSNISITDPLIILVIIKVIQDSSTVKSRVLTRLD